MKYINKRSLLAVVIVGCLYGFVTNIQTSLLYAGIFVAVGYTAWELLKAEFNVYIENKIKGE